MATETRRYTKKVRARLEEETRLRITEAAVELHGSVGPSRTTMSGLAERAGVTRSTLYRHFPDEAAVFRACSAHWNAANPPPDPGPWAAIADPDERARVALGALYGYYRRGERMLANLFRDEELDVVRQGLQDFHAFIAAIADMLLAGRGVRGAPGRRTRAALAHALAFPTWRSLAAQGLSDDEAAALMARLAAIAASTAD